MADVDNNFDEVIALVVNDLQLPVFFSKKNKQTKDLLFNSFFPNL
jgi:hypothetical protein